MSPRFGIAEWYGRSFADLTPRERRRTAEVAIGQGTAPSCPFQSGAPRCSKKGGVCSLQRYEDDDGRIGQPVGDPVTVCPARFEQDGLVVRWLAEIAGIPPGAALLARKVPFMQSTATDKPAGMIDLVVARNSDGVLDWYGLEVQAVYFSGTGMTSQFEALRDDPADRAPFPNAIRRPDWRSSSAKRLMPQLQVKVPTLRRWGRKLAVAVDRPFFNALEQATRRPSQDLNDGDVIWLVSALELTDDGLRLVRSHWEVLTLEQTSQMLLAAETIPRDDFESALDAKLEPLEYDPAPTRLGQ